MLPCHRSRGVNGLYTLEISSRQRSGGIALQPSSENTGAAILQTTCRQRSGGTALQPSGEHTRAALNGQSSRVIDPQPQGITRQAAKVFSMVTPSKTGLWHSRLGHPRHTMFRRMLPIITGHEVCISDANKVGDCAACSQGKLILQPSRWKLPTELSPKLQRLQGDVCGLISPASGPFRYFLVLVDASGTQSELTLLSTRNLIFPKILAMLLRFWTHFPDQPVRNLRVDNAKEFRSHHFKDYCVASGITLTYSVPYEH